MNRAPQLKKVCLGSKVGSNIGQNEPFRPGSRSFALNLMDRNSIKVFVFVENQSPNIGKQKWVKLDS